MRLSEIKHALTDPDGLKLIYHSLRMFKDADRPEEFTKHLANEDFEEALEASGRSPEEFVEYVEKIEEHGEKVVDRYDLSALNEYSNSELQEEIGMDDEEYNQLLHGVVLRSTDDTNDFRYK